jgi:hypothetical protein
VTTKRAMILEPRSFIDLPLQNQPAEIKWSGSRRRASVAFPGTVPLWDDRRRRTGFGPNTGLELLNRSAPRPFAFYDVANPEAMLLALEQARTGTPA